MPPLRISDHPAPEGSALRRRNRARLRQKNPPEGAAWCPLTSAGRLLFAWQFPRMSAYGYKRTFHGVRQRVRSYPESRRSRANVRFPTDFVCFTPGSGRSRDLP